VRAPLGDETRIEVVLAVLLADLITQGFERYNRTGEPLDPRCSSCWTKPPARRYRDRRSGPRP